MGSIRDQAMIAWDYDADLAIFHTKDCDAHEIGRMVSRPLTALGYRLSQHGPKTRAGPNDPFMLGSSPNNWTKRSVSDSLWRLVLRISNRLHKSGSRGAEPNAPTDQIALA